MILYRVRCHLRLAHVHYTVTARNVNKTLSFLRSSGTRGAVGADRTVLHVHQQRGDTHSRNISYLQFIKNISMNNTDMLIFYMRSSEIYQVFTSSVTKISKYRYSIILKVKQNLANNFYNTCSS